MAAAVVPVAAGPAQAHDEGFSFRCFVSHRSPDDPIVHPGLPGMSHLHDFFGNTTTDAFSTTESLLAGDTNCTIPENRSGYWIPTLLNGTTPVTPLYVNVYYRPGRKDPASVQPLPAGLRMIAGDGAASWPQQRNVVSWGCGANGMVYLYPWLLKPWLPGCGQGFDLVLYVHFPDCWDGRRLDSPDHRSHMAYSDGRACPFTHPVPVAQLVLSVHYPVRGGTSLVLSSGGKYSGHSDFMEAWDRDVLEDLVRRCINRGEHCHF
jgi:hypothetical protein